MNRYNKEMKSITSEIPVSVVMITRDAGQWLEAVLGPLAVFDEILILDSGSIDRTREIAAAYGAVWHEHSFDGYGPQKRRAVGLARHDWVLSIDADEVLQPETVAAMEAIDWKTVRSTTCWRICRRPFVGGREIRHGHWVPDPVIRLFNRTQHNFSPAQVHESVKATDRVVTLPGAMVHHSYQDLAEVFRADYHRMKAADYLRRGRKSPGVLNLSVRAGWAFFYSLIVKRGFLDGPAGVVIALSGSVNAVLGLALAGEAPQTILKPGSSKIQKPAPAQTGKEED